MTPGQVLEIAAHVVTAALALWLGLTVGTRSTAITGRLFALLAITIAAWSTSVLVELLSSSARAIAVGHTLAELTAALAIAALAHLSLLIASEGHPNRPRLVIVGGVYVVVLGLAVPAVVDPAINPSSMAIGPLPGAVYGWAWIVARLAAFGVAIAWLLMAMRLAERRSPRRRQLRAALATVIIGGVGASLRFLPVVGDADSWIGLSLVALAVVLAAYAVFAAAIFFEPTVASRVFWTSLLGGLAVVVLLVSTLAIDAAGRLLAGLDVPLFTGLALIVAVALYEPVVARLDEAVAADPRSLARERLLRALGHPTLAAQPAAGGVEPALERLAEALGVPSMEVVAADGEALAGSAGSDAIVRREAVVVDGETLGELRIAASDPARTFGPSDEELIRQTATFVGTAIRTGRKEDAQLDMLAGLSEDRAHVERQATALHEAMVRHGEREDGLVVFALGPLRVERSGSPIERWGGDKAGSRQAEGLFAFLFDRGERGVAKDEALELVWPDADLDRADLAFHRTMVGLRQTLDPTRARGRDAGVRFRNDRYRLTPAVVEWSDVDAFLRRLDAAGAATSPAERRQLLEEARTLYRGDYLDDCPFYGDSSSVEERRSLLRARAQDLLIALGESYETSGDRVSAAAAFREAIARAAEACPPAEAGLTRLGF